MKKIPFVSFSKKENIKYAEQFAIEHNLTFLSPREIRITNNPKLVIWVGENEILLQDLDDKNSKPFKLNFRFTEEENKTSNLLFKCFSKFEKSFHVLDMTGGFCQDAFYLANMGFNVTAYEKESWVYAFTSSELNKIDAKKLKYIKMNSLSALDSISDLDIVYIDPMFEIINKANAKKEIQFLRRTLDTEDEKEIFHSVWNSSAKVIVIKRHKLSKQIFKKKPSYELKGKVISFQIYDRRAL